MTGAAGGKPVQIPGAHVAVTGADVKRQAMAALELGADLAMMEASEFPASGAAVDHVARAADPFRTLFHVLDGCVLLTAEEAENGKDALVHATLTDYDHERKAWQTASIPVQAHAELLALLTAEESAEERSDDVGPPPPGEGGDLENPEIGMVC